MTAEERSAPVPDSRQRERAKPAEDVRLRWSWTEPSVWTDLMLTALEQGIKGGRWHTLIDKVYTERNLTASYAQVARNKGAAGVDHVSVRTFGNRLNRELPKVSQELRDGTYVPQSVLRVQIPKPGSHETRPLGIPTVRDRVVQTAVVNVIEPIFEQEFAEHSYGFRPGRSCKDALRRVDRLVKSRHYYVVDADLKSYFDTIPHDRLMTRLSRRISDSRMLRLIEAFLKAGVMEGMAQWTPEAGAPQGAVLSPLLSNVYLNPLDHMMADAGFQMVRYADDFVILCRTAAEAVRALELVRNWTAENGLTLHPKKTRIVDVRTESFEFLGYRFVKRYRFPRAKSVAKLKESIRSKTKRTNGRDLDTIIKDVNRSLQGWFGYFKHAYRTSFDAIDSWIRMRLRSILRKRRGLRGRGRGRDHNRWTNAFFAEHGLFNLEAAHVQAATLLKVNH